MGGHLPSRKHMRDFVLNSPKETGSIRGNPYQTARDGNPGMVPGMFETTANRCSFAVRSHRRSTRSSLSVATIYCVASKSFPSNRLLMSHVSWLRLLQSAV